MGRRWVPVLIIVVGAGLGLLVAGLPSRGQDAPIRVQSAAPSSTSTPTSVAVAATTATTVTTAPAPQARPPASVRVKVVNGSGLPGAATRLGLTIKSQGWDLKPPGPDRAAQEATSVMYRPGYDNEARALATALGLDPGAVAPLDAGVIPPDATDVGVVVGRVLAQRTA